MRLIKFFRIFVKILQQMNAKRFILLLSLFFSGAGAMLHAQLEVKSDSFKEVPGFVNININMQADDNDVPYAIVKVKTEDITDKQRRELLFQGDAATFIECEYKVGEVWVYLTYKATYLKISHPDLSSTEFYFPFDLQPKKGYELTLVNKAKTDMDEERVISLIEQWQKTNRSDDTIVAQPQLIVYEPIKKDVYNFVTANASINKYGDLSYGLTFGRVSKFGFFASVMSSFDFNGFKTDFECDTEGYVDGNYPIYTGKESVTSLSAIAGLMMRIYKPLSVRLGAGYGTRIISYETLDSKWIKNTSLSYSGIDVQLGLQCNIGGFVLSVDGVTTSFKEYEAKVGLGFGF